MRLCAAHAFQHGTPGVIVVAMGANRAESVCEGIKRGLINAVVMDRTLADALAQKRDV